MARRLEQDVHFQYEKRTLHRVGPHYALIHYTKANYFYSNEDQESLSTDADDQAISLTLLQGYAWPNIPERSRPLTATDFASMLKGGPPDIEAVRSRLNGEYAVLHLRADGLCVAFNDRLGIEHIYYHESSNLNILTNRVALAARFLGDHSHDLLNLLWLPMVGYRVGEGTWSPKVRMLPQGAFLTIRNSRLRIRENPHFMFQNLPDRQALLGDDSLLDRMLEPAIRSSAANLKSIFFKDGPVNLPITGGKDSRLVLALALQVVQRDRLHLFTNGTDDHPDVVVGRMIAKKMGLPHETRRPGPVRDTTQATDDLLSRLAIHAWQNEGMFGAWDLKAPLLSGNSVLPSGFVGEVLKGYLKKGFSFNTIPDPSVFIPMHGPYDPLGIVRSGTRKRLEQDLIDRFRNYCESGCDFNDIPDMYYIKERIPNWLGGARRLDAYSHQVVNTLNNEHLIKLAFALGYRHRQQELIHFRLLRRLDHRLLELPFAAQSWSRELTAYGAKDWMFAEPVVARSSAPMHGSWQYTVNNSPHFRQSLRELFGDYPASPLWEHLDRDVLLDKLAGITFSMPQLIELYGLCTIFMKVHDYVIPRRMQLHYNQMEGTPMLVRDVNTRVTFRLHKERLEALESPDIYSDQAIASSCLDLLRNDPSDLAEASIKYEGYVDRVAETQFSGWAWCPDYPLARLRIEAIDSETGKVLDRVVADNFRGDLVKAGKGDGHYSFNCDLAGVMDQLAGNRVTVRVFDSRFELKRSPVTLERV